MPLGTGGRNLNGFPWIKTFSENFEHRRLSRIVIKICENHLELHQFLTFYFNFLTWNLGRPSFLFPLTRVVIAYGLITRSQRNIKLEGFPWLIINHLPFDHPATVIHCQKASKHSGKFPRALKGPNEGWYALFPANQGWHTLDPGTWYTCGRSTDREFLVMQHGRWNSCSLIT